MTQRIEITEAKIAKPLWMEYGAWPTKRGYGRKIQSQYMVKSKQLGNRWLRVYMMWPCGNEPSLYVISHKNEYFVWDFEIQEKIA